MARRTVLTLSIVALAGCAGHAARPSVHGAAEAREAGPLAARLLPPWHQTLNFVLSEPAYVTIFEIVTGRGVSVVYPASGDAARQALDAGSHAVFAVPYNVGRWFYSDAPVSTQGPTFLYMIASREPLRIEQVLKNPASLRRVVGFASFTQSNEQRTMDALDERFVARYLDDDAWTSDWIALWPEPALDHPPLDATLVVPRCADGTPVVAIPGPTPGYICAPRNTKQPPAPHAPSPSDSAAPPSKTPPTDAKPDPARPADGKRPAAPRRTRAEPMSLAVDYGEPDERVDRSGRDAPIWTTRSLEPPGSARSARLWERERGDDAHPSLGGAPGTRGESRGDVPVGAMERAPREESERVRREPRMEPRAAPGSEPRAGTPRGEPTSGAQRAPSPARGSAEPSGQSR